MKKTFALFMAVVFGSVSVATAEYWNRTAHDMTSDGGTLSGFSAVYDNQILNVKDPQFGAVGNSTTGADGTDDSAAVQAALTAGAGTTVLIPEGGFRVSTALTMAANTRLVGLGHGSKLLFDNIAVGINMADNCTIENLYIGGTSSKPISAVGVTNVRIQRNYITGGTRTGTVPMAPIYLDNVTGGWITDNYLTGNGDASAADQASYGIVAYTVPSYDLHVLGNTIASSTAHIAMCLFNVSNSVVSGNDINQGNTGNGTSSGYGIAFYRSGDAANKVDNNVVSQNNVRNCAAGGLYMASSNYFSVSNNFFGDVCKNFSEDTLPCGGVAVNGGTNGAISGNTVYKSALSCLSVVSTGNEVAITGNAVDNCTTRGIRVGGTVNNLSISGNNVGTVGTNGIEIGTGLNIAVTGNTVRNAANAGIGILTDLDNSIITGNRAVGVGSAGISLPAAASGNVITNNYLVGSLDGVVDAGSGNYKVGNKRSSGAMSGTATLDNGTVTVSTVEVKNLDTILLTRYSLGGGTEVGALGVGTVTDNVSFVINSYLDNTTVALDNATVYWEIRH